MKEWQRLCPKVNDIARKVGLFIAQQAQSFDKKAIEYKGVNNLVSYVDKEAEKRLIEALQQLLPEAAFITEENEKNHHLSEKSLHWIIDPLDGTTNFIHGLPIFAISIALMFERQIVLGVVYEINRKECFYATRGGGAYCNAVKIRVSSTTSLKESLLATGFPYHWFDKNEAYLKILNELMQKSHGLRRMGSAAIDLAYVACGRFEGFFEFNLSPWDVAAGSLLVQEAGGVVGTFGKAEDFVFGREIIAAGAIFNQLQQVISRYW